MHTVLKIIWIKQWRCPHCPKNNLNLRRKTQPVTAGADCNGNVWLLFTYTLYSTVYVCTTLYEYCISGIETRLIKLHLLLLWQAQFLCGDLDYILGQCGNSRVVDRRRLKRSRSRFESSKTRSKKYSWSHAGFPVYYCKNLMNFCPRKNIHLYMC